eukprot:5090681-Prymnesium_polylepis.1
MTAAPVARRASSSAPENSYATSSFGASSLPSNSWTSWTVFITRDRCFGATTYVLTLSTSATAQRI